MSSVHVPALSDDVARTFPRRSLSFPQYERRRHQRFPISAQTEYITPGHRAQATTLDIGRGGVFLKTDRILQVGSLIQVLIDWPMLLDQCRPLRLIIFGNVLRSNAAGTAVGTTRYEFRIRGQNAARLSA